MPDDLVSAFRQALRGRGCTVERREHDWAFDFGHGYGISVAVPWRILRNGRIAYADTDDGQKFGLPQPIDGQAMANDLLAGRCVEMVELTPSTADLRMRFDGETCLELFNNSSGYEGWQAHFQADGRMVSIIGMGGGSIAIL